ncbi:MAG: pilus assembly protein PilP [Burkholderiaceae bacterium]|jgi:type IV pilus assembly protein PilP|nr:pilus assembly protein PilP [Burkholderiaceae bacterium]
MKVRLLFFAASALTLITLAGCGSGEDADLRDWMNEQRSKAVPRVTPIQPPVPYVPLAYTEGRSNNPDPFDVDRLLKSLLPKPGPGDAVLTQFEIECNQRRKEPLESYPLDAMTMVGSLYRAGIRVALVRIDKLLYQVHMGNYLGQNCGKVTKLVENEVTLREIVRDGTGEVIERPATLQLQEKTK